MYASDRGVISLYRSVSDKLARWHGDPMRKALLVTGARQVGKTFAIREFIRSTYESSLEINWPQTVRNTRIPLGRPAADLRIMR